MRRKRVESAADAEEEEEEEHSHNEGCEGNGFFACYLLASLSPRYKGHTYIGFTVNPRRRIRQHNGEIGCGAWRTKKRRPWEMVLCIYGFPTNVSALQLETFGMTLPAYALASFDVGLYAPHLVRLETWTKEFGMCVTDSQWCKEADWRDFLGFPFEWAWQHPVESLAVRKAAIGFKSLSGIANKIKLAYTMLTLPSWQSMNITVNFLSTKYMKHCASCPSLPAHMKIKIGSLDELPCYNDNIDGLSGNEDYNIDEVEFDNNTSTSGSVLDVSDEFVTPNSPKNPNDRDNISETFEQNKEFEARERTFVLQEQHQPFSSTTPLTMKSSSATSLQRVEIIEEADFTIVTNKSGADFSQPEPEQSGATLAANKIRDVSSTSIVPHDAEIIDLSTPSPSCRRVMGRNKRRVSSSIGTDFIDLTNTPNFVQL